MRPTGSKALPQGALLSLLDGKSMLLVSVTLTHSATVASQSLYCALFSGFVPLSVNLGGLTLMVTFRNICDLLRISELTFNSVR